MNYPEYVKSVLLQDIQDMASDPARFAVHPESDFPDIEKLEWSSCYTS